jgi:hypothetical protein
MEQFFLGTVLVLEEVNIVYKENIGVPVFCLEGAGPVLLERIDKLVGKVFRGDVDNLVSGILVNMVADSLHKVGFSQSRSPVNEEGVVGGCSRVSGYRKSGVAGKGILANNVGIEGIIQIQPGVGFFFWLDFRFFGLWLRIFGLFSGTLNGFFRYSIVFLGPYFKTDDQVFAGKPLEEGFQVFQMPLAYLIPDKGGWDLQNDPVFRGSEIPHFVEPGGKFLLSLFFPGQIEGLVPKKIVVIIPVCHAICPHHTISTGYPQFSGEQKNAVSLSKKQIHVFHL